MPAPLDRTENTTGSSEAVPHYKDKEGKLESQDAVVDRFAALKEEDGNHEINFRTLSWQKTALLLFGEYVCLAILALAWSWSVVGWICGFFITFGLGIITWYTSYVLWQWCMIHPEVHDICDLAAHLFPFIPRTAYEITAIMLLLNNIFLIGFHVFTGAKILNTLSDSATCTVTFQAVTAVIGILVSIPRTLNHVSLMSMGSAVCMAIAIILSLIYAGIEDAPGYGYGGSYPKQGPVQTSIGLPSPAPGFINGLNAVLNITFLWIGQILYPSFIAEMKNPADFPKALAALTIMELAVFCIVAAVGYHFIGQYSTAPIIGSLSEPWARKSAFAFVLVPTVVIGAIYSNVASKFIYRRILGNSRHTHSHTLIGWGTWIGCVVFIWVVAFVLGNIIPSMGDFLGIMSSAFDSFFGFIFWAVAYWHMNRGSLWSSPLKIALSIANILIFGLGLFMLGPGLYTSIDAIITDYSSSVREPFTCLSNAL
ncbi:transmembrane amino acid transporter protein-domain-containing protein [Kockovaella imperatae]|uniref:Transmembrane amino acid transporter protein-domain-containing protein n=1 Tax=Kockovaella imperatae TaxID=4999 RepID=A0A1Y1UBG2_9TREE|nr:transmembrane amino acid transporter protein-domain-containing protein [Kockovaella imperatae]ORX35359.1 transmembrane amino acid transporter protein-domain-containing protein [Kockovaella imperatae]